jgi:hypothetical protein
MKSVWLEIKCSAFFLLGGGVIVRIEGSSYLF